jgi:hypothetical protein
MSPDAAGRPLHTRALSLTLCEAAPPRVDFAAYVLDLRKRGFAPVAADLQGTGIIHQMHLDGVIDRAAPRIASIAARMPAVAFEATPATGGESCRDLIGRVGGLAGLDLDAGWARALGAEIGGPRGCSHILTLSQLLAPSARWGLREDERLHDGAPARRAGERIFRRDVTLDGFEIEPGRLLLVAQLNDLHCTPAAPLAQPLERLAVQREVCVRAEVALIGLTIDAIDAAERVRRPADLAEAGWRPLGERVAPLAGLSLRSGAAQAVLRHFADARDDEGPLRDALLQLAPTLIQCFAALDLWSTRLSEGAPVGAFPDSCYMWRSGGALQRGRDVPR